jgi:endonuclease/exonuclease/phosphatase family metal-dependent hydrolase
MVEIGTPSVGLRLINTHLSLHPRERAQQVDALLGPDWLASIPPGHAVLCGDLNAFGWSPVCRRLNRTLRDAQTGRLGYRPKGTWPARLHLGRIDHVFVDPAIEVLRVHVANDALAAVASDHVPLVVTLRWPRGSVP